MSEFSAFELLFQAIKTELENYKLTAKFDALMIASKGQIEKVLDIILNRLSVGELQDEIWIRDKVAGSQFFLDKYNLSHEKLQSEIMKFAQAIYSHETTNV
jgi:hypothetical protein